MIWTFSRSAASRALGCGRDVLDRLVDDGVRLDLDVLALRGVAGLGLRANAEADDDGGVAHVQGAVGVGERGDGAVAEVELRLDDVAGGEGIRVGLEIEDVGLKQDGLEQVVDALALLGRDVDEGCSRAFRAAALPVGESAGSASCLSPLDAAQSALRAESGPHLLARAARAVVTRYEQPRRSCRHRGFRRP